MDALRSEIIKLFGQSDRPHEGELVLRDGFDELEKDSAIRFYSGKSWPDVLAHLRGLKDEPVFGAAYFLEEWSVLSPVALTYYARAHLEFLCETLATPHPDEEFVVKFLEQLHEVVHMHHGSPFKAAETDLLRRAAQRIGEKAGATGSFEDWRDDIKRQADECVAAIQALSDGEPRSQR